MECAAAASAYSAVTSNVTYLDQQQAASIDEELVGSLGFSLDQLMELAGLSVACSVAAEYPPGRVLVLAGPGNNGGDGLVAARHLSHFGYQVQVCYPKRTDKPIYHGLVTQLESLSVPFLDAEAVKTGGIRQADVVIDAIFGFSFKGMPRPPFDEILQLLKPDSRPPPIVSVDIPSGWDVENGDPEGTGIQPDMLVSLTAPKRGVREFRGRFHYLGGRFVPPAIKEKYRLELPAYPGACQCVKLPSSSSSGTESASGSAGPADDCPEVDPAAMRIDHSASPALLEADLRPDPMEQFDAWFREAAGANIAKEPNAAALATADAAGRPSARMVLLKGYDPRGFSFFSNYDSRKAGELANGSAALCLYWEPLSRQVRIEGSVERLPEAESDAYFASRPRGSQIGAWVSHQSQELKSRHELEERNEALNQEYSDESIPVPRPPNWGGYLLTPTSIEFWQGRPSRLHDRLLYSREAPGGAWRVTRLSP